MINKVNELENKGMIEEILLDRSMRESAARLKNDTYSAFNEWNGPRFKAILITCMDPRVNPYEIFTLDPGDMFIIRNAGSLITNDVLRSIFMVMLRENIEEIIVMGHTDCATSKKDAIKKNIPLFSKLLPKGSYYKEIMDDESKALEYFRAFKNTATNVLMQLENLAFIKKIKSNIKITGMLYNISNGVVYGNDELQAMAELLDDDPSDDLKDAIPDRLNDFMMEESKKEEKEKKSTKRDEERQSFQDDIAIEVEKGDLECKTRLIPRYTIPNIKIRVPKIKVPRVRILGINYEEA